MDADTLFAALLFLGIGFLLAVSGWLAGFGNPIGYLGVPPWRVPKEARQADQEGRVYVPPSERPEPPDLEQVAIDRWRAMGTERSNALADEMERGRQQERESKNCRRSSPTQVATQEEAP